MFLLKGDVRKRFINARFRDSKLTADRVINEFIMFVSLIFANILCILIISLPLFASYCV